jgi:disulfide bond formation protein DsbB
VEVLLIAALLGLIPAMIARNNGRSFANWWLYGALLFIIALPHALLLTAVGPNFKKCHFCAEIIKAEAVKCKHCGSDVGVSSAQAEKLLIKELPWVRTAGLSLVSIVIGGLIGYGLDSAMEKWFGVHTTPWLLFVFALLGIVAGFREFLRMATKKQ